MAIEVSMTAEQLHMACELTGIGTFAMDTITGDVKWNSVMRKMAGYADGEEITLENYIPRVRASDIPKIKSRIAAVLRGEVAEYISEYVLMPPNGESKWVRVKGKILPGTKIIYGIITDITAEKEYEAHLVELVKSSQASKAAIHSFMDQLGDA